MNKVILVGNITRDPEQRTTGNGTPVTSFTVAVNRRYRDAQGNYPSDFINCVAWRTTAEFISKYFSKGSKIGIVGSLQSRSYDDAQGNKRYITEVVVDDAEFVTSKAQSQGGGRDDYAGLTPPPSYGGGGGGASAPPQQPSADDIFADELGDFQPLDDAELPF